MRKITHMKFFAKVWTPLQVFLPPGKIILLYIFLVVGNMGLSLPVWAWEIVTHEELTKEAIRIKEGVLNTYLIENLGLEGGLDEVVDKKTVRQWLIAGSDFEDNLPRPLNHFHDAVNNRGLEATLSGMSAIDWSLAGIGEQSFGHFSWNDAREYYFKALTSPTKTERDENWGKTFRALGQVMHLLQDAANPSHVRNDAHPDFSAFIGSLGQIDVDGLHDYMARRSVIAYPGATTFTPDSSLLETQGAVRSEPFSNLFDRNVYMGANPQATLGTDVGIAEFTNANFFSDDTIPGQNAEANFFFPDISELVPAPIPSPYLTLPRLGSPDLPAARAAKFTGNQAVAQFLLTNTNFDLIGKLQLDDEVYDAQAKNLIPRAVSYSAAVLNYFFRLQFPLEPSRHEFVVLGDPPTSVCGPPPDLRQDGSLEVGIPIPSDLNFSDGTASLYYEKPDGSRVMGEQFDFPRPFPPFDKLGLGARIPLDGLVQDQPIRWYVVLKGKAGPGVQEEQAILANTDEAAWVYMCTN